MYGHVQPEEKKKNYHTGYCADRRYDGYAGGVQDGLKLSAERGAGVFLDHHVYVVFWLENAVCHSGICADRGVYLWIRLLVVYVFVCVASPGRDCIYKQKTMWFWSILSSVFGLMYGFFCTPVHGAMSIASGGFEKGMYAAFAWWIAGIPYDIVHGAANFAVMAVCYTPVRRAMEKLSPLPRCPQTMTERK